jgi:hypothetical protein
MADETIIIDIELNSGDEFNNIRKLTDEIAKLRAANKQLAEQGEETSDQFIQNASDIRVYTAELRANQKVIDNTTKAQKQNGDSIAALRAQLSNAKREYSLLSAAERDNADVGGVLLKQTADLNAQLKGLERSYGDNQRSVGDYGKSLDGLQQRLKDIKATFGSLDIDSQEFKDASNEAQNLQLQIDQALGKVDEFGEREPKNPIKRAFGDALITVGILGQGIEALSQQFTENEDTQKALAKATQGVATALALANVIKEKGAILDTADIARKGIQAGATALITGLTKVFGITATQAWAAATLGLSILITAIVGLIANFEEVVGSVKNFLGLTDQNLEKQKELTKGYRAQQAAIEAQIASQQRLGSLVNDAFERQITLQEAAGQDASKIRERQFQEQQRFIENQIKSVQKLAELELKSTDRTAKRYTELVQQTTDLRNNLANITADFTAQTIQEARERTQKEKEEQKKRVDAEKEAASKRLEEIKAFEKARLELKINSLDRELSLVQQIEDIEDKSDEQKLARQRERADQEVELLRAQGVNVENIIKLNNEKFGKLELELLKKREQEQETLRQEFAKQREEATERILAKQIEQQARQASVSRDLTQEASDFALSLNSDTLAAINQLGVETGISQQAIFDQYFAALEENDTLTFERFLQGQQRIIDADVAQKQQLLANSIQFGDQLGNILADSIQNGELQLENFSRGLTILILDTLQRQIVAAIAGAIAQEIGTKGVAGIVTAGIATGLVNAAFNVAKAKLSAPPKGFATGVVGLEGPGTQTSDSIPAWLSKGESVITADGTQYAEQKFPGLLNFLNSPHKYATGVVNLNPTIPNNPNEGLAQILASLPPPVVRVSDIDKGFTDARQVQVAGQL